MQDFSIVISAKAKTQIKDYYNICVKGLEVKDWIPASFGMTKTSEFL